MMLRHTRIFIYIYIRKVYHGIIYSNRLARSRHFLGRRVFVLNGSWDFTFLGDLVVENVLPDMLAETSTDWSQASVESKLVPVCNSS